MEAGLDLSVDRRSGEPLGAQLAARIRGSVQGGRIARGQRLPSVRELARAAGVNVNTARAVYARLEHEGLVRSEQGRGTFVSSPPGSEALARRELRRQIAELEAELVRLPPPPLPGGVPVPARPAAGAALQSAEDLAAIRDRLLATLRDLDARRAELVEHLDRLGQPERPPRATPSLAGARIRWVGA